ncbi:MAG: Spy/CpxP family protein refolding chaperone [Gammaproteobacteria bacterium]
MKTSSKIALSLLAAAGIATSSMVLAHDYGHGRHGYGPMAHCQQGGPGAHLDTLKTELKLTAKQQPAWDTFEKAVRAQMAAHGAGHRMGHGMASGPDGMQAHIAFMEQRLAGMKTILKARTALEQVLTPEQKAVFDQFGPHHHRHG